MALKSILSDAKAIKSWASSEMDAAEAAATRDFHGWCADDGYLSYADSEVVDSDCFGDFRAAKERLKFWSDLCEHLESQSILTPSREIISALGDSAAREILAAATELSSLEEELEEHGPEDKTDFDDDWFRITDAIDNRRQQLKVLAVVLATFRLER